MEQAEIKARELIEKFYGITDVNFGIRQQKKCALICVDREIELLKELLDESVNIHQSLSTPKKLCIDILNPKLKELLEVKNNIEKF